MGNWLQNDGGGISEPLKCKRPCAAEETLRFPVFLSLLVFLCAAVLTGCAKNQSTEYGGVVITSGGSGGSGGTSGGGTSGGGTSGGGTSGGSGGSGGSGNAVPPSTVPLPASAESSLKPLQGLVNGGRSSSIAAAKVYVLQVNTTGSRSNSVSLLNSASGNRSDSIGNYTLTSAYGGFSIAGNYTCTVGHQVYLYVRGGSSGGSGANSAIGLMASLGACPAAGNFTASEPFVMVNEVTTVAAAYAMADAATDPTHVSGSGIPLPLTGRANAANLVRVATGLANATLPSDPRTRIPQSKINTLANILAACINTGGPGSSGCATLFANARGIGGAKPEDTATAAMNIAHNPRNNIAALYGLQPGVGAPFEPHLATAPDDFTIEVGNAALGSTVALLSDPR